MGKSKLAAESIILDLTYLFCLLLINVDTSLERINRSQPLINVTNILKILCISYLISVANFTYSEQIKLTRSSISELLQQPTVSAIYRDAEGILWVGTQQGLYRHNGATVSEFNTNKSNNLWIPESEIKDIQGDSEGNLFVATSGGILLIWDRKLQMFLSANASESTKYSRLVRMLVSKSGDVWLLHQQGLSRYKSELGSKSTWLAKSKIAKNVGIPLAIAEDNNGNLWIGGSKGIVYVEVHEKSFSISEVNNLDLPKSTSITVIAINNENHLLIGTNSGQILAWDPSKNVVLASRTLTGKGQIYISRFALANTKLVIGTDSGLYVSDENLSFIEEVHGGGYRAKAEDIYSLHLDGKYIWVGKINGLDIMTFAAFELFNLKNGDVSNHAIAFAQDDKDRIWIGTYSGLYLYDKYTQTHVKSNLIFDSDPMTFDDQRVVALAHNSGDLWVGLFEGGAIKIDLLSRRSYTPVLSGATKIGVTKIVVLDSTNEVWVATYDHGLFRIKAEEVDSYFKNKRLRESSITTLFNSSTGYFLAVSGNRVHQYNKETEKFHEIPFDFGRRSRNPLVYSIAQAIRNDILIGTKDYGLFIWRRVDQLNNRFKLIAAPAESSLSTSTIYAIEIDSDGNLWCSTQNGIVKLNPEGQLIKRFTTADGLQGNDFTLGASFKSRQGLIYFGGTNGYNKFDPEKIEIDSDPSPMRLTGISLPSYDKRDLGDVAGLKSLQMTHKDRFVTFQFSVLDFIDPERNQFRYTLENFDSEWIENGNGNSATYTNLPAGDYIFRVQGANSAGIWNLEGIELNVTVLPAPWRTQWAYTLYAFTFLCVLWGIIRISRSYAIDRESTQLALEMLEAENRADDDMAEQLEFQDELVRSAYEHNQRTLELVSDSIRLQGSAQEKVINHGLIDSTLKRISALSGLEDCVSYQAGGPVVNLFQYTDSIIPGLLERSPVSPDTVVTINEVTALPITAELASPISIVIYELLENCIQHAFTTDSPANYIHIRMIPGSTKEPNARCYELTVHDSGTGIPDSIENLARKGRGMAIVQFIANKLCGQLEIIKGSGTTICLTVPAIDIL